MPREVSKNFGMGGIHLDAAAHSADVRNETLARVGRVVGPDHLLQIQLRDHGAARVHERDEDVELRLRERARLAIQCASRRGRSSCNPPHVSTCGSTRSPRSASNVCARASTSAAAKIGRHQRVHIVGRMPMRLGDKDTNGVFR